MVSLEVPEAALDIGIGVVYRYGGLPAHYQLAFNGVVADRADLQTGQVAVAGYAHFFHQGQWHFGESIQLVGLFVDDQPWGRGVRLASRGLQRGYGDRYAQRNQV